jgi:hypothetical protein
LAADPVGLRVESVDEAVLVVCGLDQQPHVPEAARQSGDVARSQRKGRRDPWRRRLRLRCEGNEFGRLAARDENEGAVAAQQLARSTGGVDAGVRAAVDTHAMLAERIESQ